MPCTIFFCYAREDEILLNKLKAHLRPLQRQGLIDIWYDRNISAGTVWEEEIKAHLVVAQIILLLISPDFMESDYCYSFEMAQALMRHKRGEAQVIPIILRHTYWHGAPFSELQALPKDGKPVTDSNWSNLDEAFYDIVNSIYKVIPQLASPSAPTPSFLRERQQTVAKPHVPPSSQPPANAVKSSISFKNVLIRPDSVESPQQISISEYEKPVIIESQSSFSPLPVTSTDQSIQPSHEASIKATRPSLCESFYEISLGEK